MCQTSHTAVYCEAFQNVVDATITLEKRAERSSSEERGTETTLNSSLSQSLICTCYIIVFKLLRASKTITCVMITTCLCCLFEELYKTCRRAVKTSSVTIKPEQRVWTRVYERTEPRFLFFLGFGGNIPLHHTTVD